MKIIYYTDGTKEVFITLVENMNVHYTPPDWPSMIERMFKIINQILKTLAKVGVGSFLLAWGIWNLIKSLRKGRPRDYYGVGLNYS